MAEEHVGAEGKRPLAWLKIFSGFKVALDLKKLLLAAAGLLAVWLAWWFVSWIAYALPGRAQAGVGPRLRRPRQGRQGERAGRRADFKAPGGLWNLLHELAGPLRAHPPLPVEPADVAVTLPEYERLRDIAVSRSRFDEDFRVIGKEPELKLEVGVGLDKKLYPIIVDDPKDLLKPKDDQERASRCAIWSTKPTTSSSSRSAVRSPRSRSRRTPTS